LSQALQRTTDVGRGEFVDDAVAVNDLPLLEFSPTFRLTRDQSAWLFDAVMTVKRSASDIRQIAVRVVSAPRAEEPNADDAVTYWTDRDGERLKAQSAALVAEAMSLALQDVGSKAQDGEVPFKTVRYAEGRTERFERAQLLASRCDRVVVLTLRGTLLSVPANNRCPSPIKQ